MPLVLDQSKIDGWRLTRRQRDTVRQRCRRVSRPRRLRSPLACRRHTRRGTRRIFVPCTRCCGGLL